MAIVNNVSAASQWDDLRRRLIADYASLASSISAPEPYIRLCDLNVESDDFSIRIGGKRHLFHHGGPFGEKLSAAVHEGKKPGLMFKFFWDRGPDLYIVGGELPYSDTLALIADKGPEEMLLPKVLEDEVLSIAFKNFDKVYPVVNEVFLRELKAIYDSIGITRSDELIMKLSDHLVSDDVSLDPVQLYNVLQLIPDDELQRVKAETLKSVKEFYGDMFRNGELSSKAEVEAGVAYASQRLDEYFSAENRLFAKLSFRVANIGTFNGEVQTDDIARVAVWAEMDPAYAPFLGKKLERWVASESVAYGLKQEIVNRKREELGGKISKRPVKPKFSDDIKALAAKRFGVKIS